MVAAADAVRAVRCRHRRPQRPNGRCRRACRVQLNVPSTGLCERSDALQSSGVRIGLGDGGDDTRCRDDAQNRSGCRRILLGDLAEGIPSGPLGAVPGAETRHTREDVDGARRDGGVDAAYASRLAGRAPAGGRAFRCSRRHGCKNAERIAGEIRVLGGGRSSAQRRHQRGRGVAAEHPRRCVLAREQLVECAHRRVAARGQFDAVVDGDAGQRLDDAGVRRGASNGVALAPQPDDDSA
mmetsp:Transcript_20720/g.73159  ORF Transcript_20720/g.73159 Transcript_20720/m.73159 type:complete len:239 (-) Transcript_20720:2379-3095(-)